MTVNKYEAISLQDSTVHFQKKLSEANDEIIQLKMTISGLEPSSKPLYSEIVKTKKASPILFKGENSAFSNFYKIKGGIDIFTQTFSTGEGAYNFAAATREGDWEKAQSLVQAKHGKAAFDIGKTLKKGPAWDTEKLAVLRQVLHRKYEVCPEYREELMNSGDAELIEDTPDPEWGRGTQANPGKNMLGKLHMQLRKEKRGLTLDHSTPSKPPQITAAPQHTKKKQITIVGNSQTASLNHTKLENQDSIITHIKMPKIDQALTHIKKMSKTDVLIIHEITNDIGTSMDEIDKCVNDLTNLANEGCQKATDVILSLGLPRSDNKDKHEATKMANLKLKMKLTSNTKIKLIEHENFLYHGKANRYYFNTDGIHLNDSGKTLFLKNIARALGRKVEVWQQNTQSPTRTTSQANPTYRHTSTENRYTSRFQPPYQHNRNTDDRFAAPTWPSYPHSGRTPWFQ